MLHPEPGTCFGSVKRAGSTEGCRRIVAWRGTLTSTRNGISWEVDACDWHARQLVQPVRLSELASRSVVAKSAEG